MEIWRTPKDFPNYKVSSQGKIRSLKTNRDMHTWQSNSKYEMVGLRNETGKLSSGKLGCEPFFVNTADYFSSGNYL